MTRSPEEIRKWGSREAERIRADRDLSEEGRKRRLHEVHTQVKAELGAHSAERDKADRATLDAARKNILRPPGGHRAESRALLAQMEVQLKTPDDARKALRNAQISGDDLLTWAVRAVAADRASDHLPGQARRWRPVLDESAADDAAFAGHLRELDAASGQVRSFQQRLADSMNVAPVGLPEGYRPPADSGDRDKRDDLTDGGRRRFDIRDQVNRVHDQQRSMNRLLGRDYIGPSAGRDRGDETGVYTVQTDA